MKSFKTFINEYSLWKYNKRSGIWDHQRNVTPETSDQWTSTFKKDEPEAHFHISKNKPKHNPVKNTVSEDGAAGPAPAGSSAPTNTDAGIQSSITNPPVTKRRQTKLQKAGVESEKILDSNLRQLVGAVNLGTK